MNANEVARPTGSAPSILSANARGIVTALVRPVATLAEMAMVWSERRRQRNALMSLDDHLLKDIGVSRLDAEMEGVKPFWRD